MTDLVIDPGRLTCRGMIKLRVSISTTDHWQIIFLCTKSWFALWERKNKVFRLCLRSWMTSYANSPMTIFPIFFFCTHELLICSWRKKRSVSFKLYLFWDSKVFTSSLTSLSYRTLLPLLKFFFFGFPYAPRVTYLLFDERSAVSKFFFL